MLFRSKDEERAALVEKCAAEALLDNLSGIYNENARNEYLVKRLVLMAKQSVNVLAYQLKQGDFIPYEFEKSFSYNNGIKTMKIELERHNNLKLFLNLNGKVDRIDIYSDDDKVFAKIIDYKTGQHVSARHRLRQVRYRSRRHADRSPASG